MAGFFRRVAGAFVEIETSPDDEAAAVATGKRHGDPNLDEITRGASELLAQLESNPASAPGRAATSGESAPADAATHAELPPDSIMGLTAEQVFARSGLGDGPQSAPRVLKIIAGLSMFPPEQQIVMLRAMDQADDTWSEEQVLEDARRRQSALRTHLQAVDTERTARIQDLDSRIQSTQNLGRELIDEIDRRIAELTGQRETAIADSTSAVNRLDQQKKEVEDQAEQTRRGITHVVNALSALMGFFAGGKGQPATSETEGQSQSQGQRKKRG